VIDKDRAKIIKANKDEYSNTLKLLTENTYIPSGEGYYVTTNCMNGKYIPCTLLKRLSGINNLQIKNSGVLRRRVDKEKMLKALESFGLQYSLLYWQAETLHLMLELKFGRFDLSMNAGKSFISYLFCLMRAIKGYKTLIVVPKVTLATQMRSNFYENSQFLKAHVLDMLGGEFKVDTIYNKSERNKSNIIIGNAASLRNMAIKSKNKSHPDYENCKTFFDEIDYIIFDECHTMIGDGHYKKDSDYLKILNSCANIKSKFGYTGSPHIKGAKSLLMDNHLGTIMYRASARELEDAGQSAKHIYEAHVIEIGEIDTKKFESKMEQYKSKVLNGNVATFFNHNNFIETLPKNIIVKRIYKDKYWALGDKKILKSVANRKDDSISKKTDYKIVKYNESLAYNFSKMYWSVSEAYKNTILQNIQSHPPKENQLVFVDNLKDLYKLEEELKGIGREVIIFHGGVKAEDRPIIMNRLENGEGVILVSNYQLMSVGVSIKKLHRMHFYSSCKESVRFMQSFGRIIRKHSDIPLVFIHDWSTKLWASPSKTNRKYAESDYTTKKHGYLYNHQFHRLKTLKERLGYEYKRIVHTSTME